MPNIQAMDVDVDVPPVTEYDKATGQIVVVKPASRRTVRLVIDINHLRRTLCKQAARNRTGKAVLGGGAITAKVRL